METIREARPLGTMLAVLKALEKLRHEGWPAAPVFDVRLDGGHDDRQEKDERKWSIRVTVGTFGEVGVEQWAVVLRTAMDHGLDVTLDNAAMVLR